MPDAQRLTLSGIDGAGEIGSIHVEVLPNLDTWFARIAADHSVAFSPEFVAIAADDRQRFPQRWQRIRAQVRRSRTFDWKGFVRAVEAVVAIERQAPPAALKAVTLPDNDTHYKLPPGFHLYDDATTRDVAVNDVVEEHVVAHAPVAIRSKCRDIDDDREFLEIGFGANNSWRFLKVDRAVAFNSRKLLELAGIGFPVAEENAKELAKYLHRFEAANPGMPVQLISSHLGWQGEGGAYGFLIGETLIDSNGELHE